MKVENGLQAYKSILELQKQLVDMLVQQNLQTNRQDNTQTQQSQTEKPVIEGKKVSIYA
ncbi:MULTISPECIES: hypothetical protein [Persephonella]|uniref:Uncharacterized protein n=1 Tax=Persephonella marina (strain DSM 14350 / EX-H1) TaxID=123214 RepID=C0QQR1_PERMH|nr:MULTISPECIES: hypothetical protein [Persephonella]ACO04359.1 hypothetical protein PERMA_1234 [Persephonella marina EX-H1]